MVSQASIFWGTQGLRGRKITEQFLVECTMGCKVVWGVTLVTSFTILYTRALKFLAKCYFAFVMRISRSSKQDNLVAFLFISQDKHHNSTFHSSNCSKLTMDWQIKLRMRALQLSSKQHLQLPLNTIMAQPSKIIELTFLSKHSKLFSRLNNKWEAIHQNKVLVFNSPTAPQQLPTIYKSSSIYSNPVRR